MNAEPNGNGIPPFDRYVTLGFDEPKKQRVLAFIGKSEESTSTWDLTRQEYLAIEAELWNNRRTSTEVNAASHISNTVFGALRDSNYLLS